MTPAEQTARIAPKQRRSAETEARILAAVSKLIDAARYAQTSVQELTSQAGCSVGAFYGRFGDKDAALCAVYSERCSDFEARARQTLSPTEADQTLSGALDAFADTLIERAVEDAAFLQPDACVSAAGAARLEARAQRTRRYLIGWMQKLLVQHSEAHAHPDAATAAFMAVSMLDSLTRDSARAGADAAALKRFKPELMRAVNGYLGVAEAA